MTKKELAKLNELVFYSLNNLFIAAEENYDKSNIDCAIGEIEIGGVEYQIQVSLIAEKKIWGDNNNLRFSSVVKVHK